MRPPKLEEIFNEAPAGMKPLDPETIKEIRPLVAWAQREDGDRSANDVSKYLFRKPDEIWGPGGVIVKGADGWDWADNGDDPDAYYTPEYRRAFP